MFGKKPPFKKNTSQQPVVPQPPSNHPPVPPRGLPVPDFSNMSTSIFQPGDPLNKPQSPQTPGDHLRRLPLNELSPATRYRVVTLGLLLLIFRKNPDYNEQNQESPHENELLSNEYAPIEAQKFISFVNVPAEQKSVFWGGLSERFSKTLAKYHLAPQPQVYNFSNQEITYSEAHKALVKNITSSNLADTLNIFSVNIGLINNNNNNNNNVQQNSLKTPRLTHQQWLWIKTCFIERLKFEPMAMHNILADHDSKYPPLMTIALLVLTLQELIQFLKFYATVFPEQKNTYDIIDQAVKNNVSKNTPFYYALFNPDAQVFRWLLVVYKKAGKGHLLCQRNSFSEDIFDKAAFGVYTGNNPCLSFSLTEEGRNKLNEFITFFDNQRANPEVIDYLFQRSTLTKCVASSMEKPNRPKEALNTWGKYKYDPQYSFYQNILQNGLINRTHLPGINGFSLIAICYASLWLNWPNPKDKEIIQQLQVTFIKILTNMQTYPQDLQQEKISPTLIDYVKTGCLIDDLPRIDLCQHAQNYPIQKNAQVNSSFSQFILSIFRQYGYIDKKLELSPEQQHQWKDGIPLDKPLKQPFLGLLEHTYNPPNN